MQGKNEYSNYSFETCSDGYDAIIYAIITSYYNTTNKKPHIISNRMEDEELLVVLKKYQDNKYATISYVPIDIDGIVDPSNVENEITKNKPALVVISPGNYLTGSLNNISKIRKICHKYHVPLFSSYRYFFGFVHIDSDCFIFETDRCILSISNNLLKGYNLDKAPIFKQQLNSSEIHATKCFLEKLKKKCDTIKKYRDSIILRSGAIYYSDFVQMKDTQKIKVIVFGSKNQSVPNILGLLFVNKKNKKKLNSPFKLLGINDKWLAHIHVFLLNALTKKDVDKIVSMS